MYPSVKREREREWVCEFVCLKSTNILPSAVGGATNVASFSPWPSLQVTLIARPCPTIVCLHHPLPSFIRMIHWTHTRATLMFDLFSVSVWTLPEFPYLKCFFFYALAHCTWLCAVCVHKPHTVGYTVFEGKWPLMESHLRAVHDTKALPTKYMRYRTAFFHIVFYFLLSFRLQCQM